MLKRFVSRLIHFLRPDRAERELDREIASHVALLEDEYRRRGLSAAEAQRAARLALGGVEQTRQLHRDARSFLWLDDARRDLLYAARSLRRTPGFALVAILTLGLGIGANTAIFGLVDALLLRWLPVHNPRELVALVRVQGSSTGENFSYPQVQRFAGETAVFSSLCGYGEGTLNVGPTEIVQPVAGMWVSGSYYQTLGLMPAAGRLLNPDDDRQGAQPAAVISDGYWERTFNRDPAVVGRPLLIEGVPVPIVGVSPRGFEGAIVGSAANITLAIGVRPQLQPERASFVTAGARWLRTLARPRAGISRDQLKARLAVVWTEMLGASVPPTATPDVRRQMLAASTIDVRDGRAGSSSLRAQFRQPLLILMGVVGLVLAIACANVANLLLARATARQREISVRLAIGAGRSRLVRQLLTESALLAAVGAAVGILLASVGSEFLLGLIASGSREPDASGVILETGMNWRVLAFTSVVSLFTTVLFGLAPAFQATTRSRAAAIGVGSMRIATARGLLAPALVTTQVAISVVLLIAAGLFLRTLENLQGQEMGFRHRGVLLAQVDARRAGYRTERLLAFNQAALDYASKLPGVRSASSASVTPLMGGGISMPIALNGRPLQGDIGGREFHFNSVGPGYFATLSTAIVSGREFSLNDDAAAPPVAIVNQAFVRAYMADGDPLAQRVSVVGAAFERQVVGVVGDAAYETLRQSAPPTVYTPIAQTAAAPTTLIIAADGSLDQIAAAIRAEVQPKLAGIPVTTRTLTNQVETNLAQERLMATIAGIFGAVAMGLAVLGLYGLLTYTVARRTGEIGIRLALGASRSQVLRLVMSDAFRMLAAGLAVGAVAGWGTLRLISSMLFGLTSNDPATMTVAATLMLTTGLLAGFLPAFRASRVDALTAIRTE